MMIHISMYQCLRALQALAAGVGVIVSGLNLRDAWRDQQWLTDNNYNGLRRITAVSLVLHELGRFLMQFLLCLIGLLGMLTQTNPLNDIFDHYETILDTVVSILVLAISLHSRHMRFIIQRYHEEHP